LRGREAGKGRPRGGLQQGAQGLPFCTTRCNSRWHLHLPALLPPLLRPLLLRPGCDTCTCRVCAAGPNKGDSGSLAAAAWCGPDLLPGDIWRGQPCGTNLSHLPTTAGPGQRHESNGEDPLLCAMLSFPVHGKHQANRHRTWYRTPVQLQARSTSSCPTAHYHVPAPHVSEQHGCLCLNPVAACGCQQTPGARRTLYCAHAVLSRCQHQGVDRMFGDASIVTSQPTCSWPIAHHPVAFTAVANERVTGLDR
jgi:hypothetical protein